MTLPLEIYTVDSVRQIDAAAINDAGIDGYTLMTRAADAALALALDRYPDATCWQVVCGAGNNAGDGYVLARLAAERGIQVSALSGVPPTVLRGDAATAWQDCVAAGVPVHEFAGRVDQQTDLIIDALLGSGISRHVDGQFGSIIEAVNRHPAAVLALDLPSGLHGDTGHVMRVAVEADATITFVALKAGLFLGSGQDLSGEVSYADLDIPPACFAAQRARFRRISRQAFQHSLLPRPRAAHKGDFGHVLVVGGGPGMPGAAQLCAEAALACGAGLVSVATHPQHCSLIPVRRPELMCHGIANAADMKRLMDRATVIALGPGLGQCAWAQEMYQCAMSSGVPVIIDADGLNLLARNNVAHADRTLTPHPGEAGRLLGMNTGEVQFDRPKCLRQLQTAYDATIVLKGSGTLVSADDGIDWLSVDGNPGMAAPGMGDVLTGVIAAMRAQGLSQALSAVAGVRIHAGAGDSAAENGQRGMLATDLIAELRAWVNP